MGRTGAIRRSTRPIIGLGCVIAGRSGKRIAITFDDETFDRIRSIAVKRQVSFSEVARELVEWGLMDAEDGR